MPVLLPAMFLALAASGRDGAGTRPGPCPVELAEYSVRGAPDIDVAFYPAASNRRGSATWDLGVALRIDLRPSGEDSWWVPLEVGSSDIYTMSRVALRESGESRERIMHHQFRYYLFDANFDRIYDLPMRGAPAPAHMFLADLRSIFWYQPADMNRRASPPEEMLDFKRCAWERRDAPAPDLVGLPPYA
ncbi:hypothetical protein [Sphingosinithalassobacter portus]|uniref:hypothetical protein n=1 Tax=Stakelama portus TaxID=2676234 RepID=UPI000D6E7307|nr:hypothetical protein [Sphingosinithalassobacter portus]